MPTPPGHHPVEPDTPSPEDPVRHPLHQDHPTRRSLDDDEGRGEEEGDAAPE